MSDWVDSTMAAQGLFRHIVQHGPVALLATDASGRIVLASREAVRLLGWDPKGRPFVDVFDGQDRQVAETYLAALASNPSNATRSFAGELLHAGGEERLAQITGRWLAAVPGGPLAVVALLDAPGQEPERRPLPLGSGLDRLTGLPDRAVLFEHLDEACRTARDRGAVAIVDVDRFRSLNDRLGRDAGDRALRTIGRRLAAAVAPGVLVARIGGDEFVLLFPEADVGDAATAVDRALAEVREPLVLGGEELLLTASAGVASLEGGGSDRVLRRADAAMYEAKKSGRGGVVVYGPDVALWAENLWDLAATVARLEHDRVRLEAESRTDALTGLPNARALGEAMRAMMDPAASGHDPLSVLFVDLDRFGLYNKRQGDSSGDVALRLVASAVAAACREGDTAYRKGGEELVLLLPRTTHADALAVGERVRAAVEELQIPHEGHPDTPILTITVGVATTGPGDTVDGVQAAAADAALRSKSAERRNRTVSANA